MKGKGSLALMEQLVMLLVFALAAALCLQVFVKSDQMSKDSEAADHAMVLCQSVAETIRSEGGSAEEAIAAAMEKFGGNVPYGILYNQDWSLAQAEPQSDGLAFDMQNGKARYHLAMYAIESDIPGLAKAGVALRDEYASEDKAILCRIEFSWQKEVTAHG